MTKVYKDIKYNTIIRIEAVSALYEYHLTNKNYIDIINDKDYEELLEDNTNIIKFREDLIKKIRPVIDNLDKINNIIDAHLFNYTLQRLNKVDLAILELACSEFLENKLEHTIIINEALNISKVFTETSNFNSVSFNNRLLDNISKTIKNNYGK